MSDMIIYDDENKSMDKILKICKPSKPYTCSCGGELIYGETGYYCTLCGEGTFTRTWDM